MVNCKRDFILLTICEHNQTGFVTPVLMSRSTIIICMVVRKKFGSSLENVPFQSSIPLFPPSSLDYCTTLPLCLNISFSPLFHSLLLNSHSLSLSPSPSPPLSRSPSPLTLSLSPLPPSNPLLLPPPSHRAKTPA